MKILLLSDFHYQGPNKAGRDDHAEIVDKLLGSVKEQEGKIDMILFGGDLVNRGQDEFAFKQAYSVLLNTAMVSCGVDPSQLFMCAGNHDVDRTKIHPAVLSHVTCTLTTNEALDEFVSSSIDLEPSLHPLDRYNEFTSEVHPPSGNSIIDRFYTAHIRQHGIKRLGIVTINTSWCSSRIGEDADGILRFPLSKLKDAYSHIRATDTKILLMHHPLSALGPMNGAALEEFIHTKFDILIQGHIHDVRTGTHLRAGNGILEKVAPATVSFEEAKALGYSILEFDIENPNQIQVQDFIYNKATHVYEGSEQAVVTIPCNADKHKQNELRSKIKRLFATELGKANDLLLNNDDPRAFLNLFTDPVLRTCPESEITTKEDAAIINFGDVLESSGDLMIIGEDKYGKTSILRKIQLHLLENYAYLGVVPFYMDCKESSINNKATGLLVLIARQLELSKADTEKLLQKGKIKLLVDNILPSHSSFGIIEEFLKTYPEVGLVLTTNPSMITSIESLATRAVKANRIFIHDLGRRQLRTYTGKWMRAAGESADEVMEHITKLCDQMHLPMNFWTVSLLLDIYGKSRDDYSKNLYEVLDLCIEDILKKRALALSQTPVNYDQYKDLCCHLAHYLYMEGPETVHSSSVAKVMSFISDYINATKRFVANPTEVYQYLIKCSLLKERENGTVTFRLSGFFEYFLAFYLTINDEFRNAIMQDPNAFYAFKNEFELYSGFLRNDDEFLKATHKRTIALARKIEADFPEETIDSLLETESTKKSAHNSFGDVPQSEVLSADERDDLLDSSHPIHIQAEVQPKVFDADGFEDSVLLEKSLKILGRVFKNMDRIRDNALIKDVFKDIVRAYCYLAFKVIDSVSLATMSVDGKSERDSAARELLELASNFIPLYIQVSLFDGMGHQNLRRIIREVIEEYRLDLSGRQFELFLLYFLLIDSDLKRNIAAIDEVLEVVHIGLLRFSIYLKLNYYLVFKTGRDEKLIAELRKRIQLLSKEFNKESGLSDLHKRFSKTQSRNVAKAVMKT